MRGGHGGVRLTTRPDRTYSSGKSSDTGLPNDTGLLSDSGSISEFTRTTAEGGAIGCVSGVTKSALTPGCSADTGLLCIHHGGCLPGQEYNPRHHLSMKLWKLGIGLLAVGLGIGYVGGAPHASYGDLEVIEAEASVCRVAYRMLHEGASPVAACESEPLVRCVGANNVQVVGAFGMTQLRVAVDDHSACGIAVHMHDPSARSNERTSIQGIAGAPGCYCELATDASLRHSLVGRRE